MSRPHTLFIQSRLRLPALVVVAMVLGSCARFAMVNAEILGSALVAQGLIGPEHEEPVLADAAQPADHSTDLTAHSPESMVMLFDPINPIASAEATTLADPIRLDRSEFARIRRTSNTVWPAQAASAPALLTVDRDESDGNERTFIINEQSQPSTVVGEMTRFEEIWLVPCTAG